MNRFPLIVEAEQPARHEVCREARVISDGGITTVYVWNPKARDVDVALRIVGEPVRAGYLVWRVSTADGESWLLRDDGHCGCSHPLKAWRPAVPSKVRAGA